MTVEVSSTGDAHDKLRWFREQFPVARRMAYFANGSVGAGVEPVLAASRAWTQEWAEDPQPAYRSFAARRERLREDLARLIGAHPDEVALTENAARGAHMAARLLASVRGDHVLVDETTYPSSRYPWLLWSDKRLRAVSNQGEDPTAALVAAVTETTAAVTISHVDWVTGSRHDLRALADAAHAHGALLIVDASQSVGAIPVDVVEQGVDVMVGTFGKWLLGGPGLAFLYVRRELMVENATSYEPGFKNLLPEGVDWPQEELPGFIGTARVFEPATPNVHGFVTAQAGLDVVNEVGVELISATIEQHMSRARAGLVDLGIDPLTPGDPDRRAGLLSFPHPRAPELAAYLRERRVEITGYAFSIVRIDPNAFNLSDEVDLMLETLGEALRTRG